MEENNQSGLTHRIEAEKSSGEKLIINPLDQIRKYMKNE
jgi:hypothetical protein